MRLLCRHCLRFFKPQNKNYVKIKIIEKNEENVLTKPKECKQFLCRSFNCSKYISLFCITSVNVNVTLSRVANKQIICIKDVKGR